MLNESTPPGLPDSRLGTEPTQPQLQSAAATFALLGSAPRLHLARLVCISGRRTGGQTPASRRTIMSGLEIAGATALVTGASRGFGRGIATALSQAGAQVTGVARDPGPLAELHAELGGSFTAVAADAADPNVAGRLIDTCRPRILVLNAGATPLPPPIQQHTWETLGRNWDVDVRHAFGWTREPLL